MRASKSSRQASVPRSVPRVRIYTQRGTHQAVAVTLTAHQLSRQPDHSLTTLEAAAPPLEVLFTAFSHISLTQSIMVAGIETTCSLQVLFSHVDNSFRQLLQDFVHWWRVSATFCGLRILHTVSVCVTHASP